MRETIWEIFLKEIKDPILSKYYDYQNFSQNLIHNQNIIDNIHKKI